MSKPIYKYVGPDILKKSFSNEGECRFKCSLPKDFNDPYELFLTVDYNQKPELLAFYAETVGNLPQRATTCFSRSPSVIPMWAHYGHNHRGLVIEVDEEKITDNFPEIGFGDVDYQDEAHDHILDHLYRAFGTGKPRHTYFLTQAVLSAAYYTKRKCWSYEEERRLVAPPAHIEESDGLLILPLPISCVSGIISGYQAEPETLKFARDFSSKIGCNYYHAVIGKSTAEPYFTDTNGNIFTFNNGALVNAKNICKECKEPVSQTVSICPWCSIDESHQRYAAGHNPMRVLDNSGLLQNYLQGMREIDEGRGQ